MSDDIDLARLETQVDHFCEMRPTFVLFAEIMQSVLKDALKDLGIHGMVQARAKGIPNFTEKAIRKSHKYQQPAYQFTDLCGARIILDCKDDIPTICNFVRSHFEIDEANSEDVLERLGAGEFGYRSVHFIVALIPGQFETTLAKLKSASSADKECDELYSRLYERRTEAKAQAEGLPAGPVYKAEIQVRTILQHAWATVSHDRIYKSDFDVPKRLVRDVNRVAANLEEADDAFARAIRGVESYMTHYGAYMTEDERRKELGILQAMAKHDPDNQQLAHKMGQLHLSLDELTEAKTTMQPFVSDWERSAAGKTVRDVVDNWNRVDDSEQDELRKQLTPLRNPDMSELLLDYGTTLMRCHEDGAELHFRLAVALNENNTDAKVALANALLADDPEDALPVFTDAYETDASHPQALAGFLLCKMSVERNLDFVSLTGPSLRAAIDTCRERARVGVYLPQAFFDIGLFRLLLKQPDTALAAYAKSVDLCDSTSLIEVELERLKHLQKAARKDLPGLDAAIQFLTAAIPVKQVSNANSGELPDTTDLVSLRSRTAPDFSTPVVLVAGGCEPSLQAKIEDYRALLEAGFQSFNGTIVSGGTTAGVPGMIGDLPQPTDGTIKKVSCLPASIPAWTQLHPDYEAYYTQGSGFSAADSVQLWIDLLTAGIDPREVVMLGINGGSITACELRLALSLGARVIVLPESGRAATEITSDEDWSDHPRLIAAPDDPQTLRALIMEPRHSDLPENDREAMAQQAHEEYRQNQAERHTKADPAMAPWDELAPDLKESNRQQIDWITEKLRAVGLTIRKCEGIPALFPLSDTQIEIMSEVEHGRWNSEKLLDNWRLGPDRDRENRTSPYLVKWNELPEDIREWDRQAIRAMPKQLADAGYEIVPITES